MLVLITSNYQVYSIENALFSARRQSKEQAEAKAQKELESATILPQPKYKDNSTHEDAVIDVKSTVFPPYDGVIPQRNTRFISYDLHLVGLKDIFTFSTRLESTSAVLVTGHDMFYARVTAESVFDRLDDHFKSAYMYMVIGGLLALLWFAGNYTKSKEAKEHFLIK